MIEAVSALFPLLWILVVTVIFFAGYSPNIMSFLPKRHAIAWKPCPSLGALSIILLSEVPLEV